jgi:hypothetical protein
MKHPGVWIGGAILLVTLAPLFLLRSRSPDSSSWKSFPPPARASSREADEDPAERSHRSLQARIDKARLRQLLDSTLDTLRSGKPVPTESLLTGRSREEYELLVRGIMEATDIPLSRRTPPVSSILEDLAGTEPVKALQMLDELAPLLPERNGITARLLTETVATAAENDPQAAADWYLSHLERFGDQPTEKIPQRILIKVSSTDPATAFSLIDTLQIKDQDAAVRAIASGPFLPEKINAVLDETLKQSDAMTDPAAVAARQNAALQGIASGLSGNHGIGDGYSVEYGNRDSYEYAMAWLTSVDFLPGRLQTIAAALEPAAKPEDNPKWIDWMSTQLPPEQVAERAGPMIASWAEHAPQDAEQWLASTTAGPVKDAGIEAAVNALAPTDPAAATRIAQMLPEGPRRDKLVATAGGN